MGRLGREGASLGVVRDGGAGARVVLEPKFGAVKATNVYKGMEILNPCMGMREAHIAQQERNPAGKNSPRHDSWFRVSRVALLRARDNNCRSMPSLP